MSGLTITHADAGGVVFAPKLQVLQAEQQGKALALTQACALVITDAASMAKANDIAVVCAALEKEIEARRLYLKRPLIDTGKAIEAIIDGVAAPLGLARRSLVGRIAAYDRQQREAAAAAARKAAEDAEKERARLQAIDDDEHRQKVAAERAKAEADARELETIIGTPVAAEPVKVEAAPVVRVAPVAVAAPVPPAAVTTRMVAKLIVDERHPALAAFRVGGELLITVNHAAVRRALDAGAVLNGGTTWPWAHIEMCEQVAMKAVRT